MLLYLLVFLTFDVKTNYKQWNVNKCTATIDVDRQSCVR